jgi:hypothetical protein
MPVVSLESPPQPAVVGAGTVTGGGDGDANTGVGVEVAVAPVPPPQATSMVKSSAGHTCLISSPCLSWNSDQGEAARCILASIFRSILMAAIATVFYNFCQWLTCFRTVTRAKAGS